MVTNINKVTLLGNVGQDPEVRDINEKNKVANLTLATGTAWKDKVTGEKRENRMA